MQRVHVWDLPLRVFHWALAICVIAAYISQNIGGNAMVWHGRFGLAVLGLVSFRLVWGFVGSTNARFINFVRGPTSIKAYLRGQWSGLGHNPLGALSVVAILIVLLTLTLTGLFANDDILFEGPLYALVDKSLSDQLTKIHQWFEPFILSLVAIHVAAIGFYVWMKKQSLVRPMLTGWKEVPAASGLVIQEPERSRWGAFLFALAVALAVVFIASGQWVTPTAGY
ncbi:MAG: cytochrome b/b6 domain-containing protein [Rugosibacter sp.]|nr:cytochrome b/b6 domain-containing protein [Rugosibacter sp.]